MSSPAETFLERVQRSLASLSVDGTADRILAAVSGGPDSVCLLYVLHELGLRCEVAHFHHQTRSEEGEADAKFVERLAGLLDLPFHLKSLPVERLAGESSLSFEEMARNLRYDFLFETARARGCNVVATGHHADDQAETLLMRSLRGTGPSGLGGIPPVVERGGLRVVRPLIGFARTEIEAFLERRDYPYRLDSSNNEQGFLRNRVRLDLLPALEESYNPRLREALCRLAEAQRTDGKFIDGYVREFLARCARDGECIDRGIFREGHAALQRRAVMQLAWSHGVDCVYERVLGAVAFICEHGTGKAYDLGGGWRLENDRTHTRICADEDRPPTEHEAVELAIPGATAAFGKRFEVRRAPSPLPSSSKEYCTPTRQLFDARRFAEGVVVRHRQKGDRIRPLGMNGSKKLKDYFIDAGVPRHERDERLVLASGSDVLWVVGGPVSAEAALQPDAGDAWEVSVSDEAE